MRFEKFEIGLFIITVLSFLTGIFLYKKMPETMASHWNLYGEVDGYLPRFWGVFIIPLLLVGLTCLYILIPRLAQLKENIQSFIDYYYIFAIFTLVFFYGIYIQVLLWNLGIEISFFVTLPFGVGLLYFYLGILCENTKRNGFIGIRTPWTIRSDCVWKETNRFGGKMLKLCGFLSFWGIIFNKYAFFLMIIPIVLTGIISSFYSYILYQRKKI